MDAAQTNPPPTYESRIGFYALRVTASSSSMDILSATNIVSCIWQGLNLALFHNSLAILVKGLCDLQCKPIICTKGQFFFAVFKPKPD